MDIDTRSEIQKCVRYIKDDRYIASLYRVRLKDVQRIRARVEVPEAPRTHKSTSMLSTTGKISDPGEEGWVEMNVEGSRRMLLALMKHYRARAIEWDCDWADAGAWLNGSMRGDRPGKRAAG